MQSTHSRELAERRRVADLAINDVLADARTLLELSDKLQAADKESEAYEDLRIELEVQVSNIRVHAMSAEEAVEDYTDALPDDD